MPDWNATARTGHSFDQQLDTLFQLWSALSGKQTTVHEDGRTKSHASVPEHLFSPVTGQQPAEEVYQLLVDNSFQGLAIVQDFEIVYANPVLTQITGYSFDEMREFSSGLVMAALQSEDQSRAWRRLIASLNDGALPPRLELCCPHKDGSVRWAETYANSVMFRGKPTVLVTCIDITERKQAELELQQIHGVLELRVRERTEALATANGALQAEIIERRQVEKELQRAHDELEMRVQRRTEQLAKVNKALQSEIAERKQIEEALRRSEELFRALSENAADIITVVADDGTIRYESPSIKRILGYEPDDLIGQNVFDYVHVQDRKRVRQVFQQALATHGATHSIEFRFQHRDGSWRTLESNGKNPVGNSVVDGLVVHSRDATQRKEIEDEKARLLEKVQEQHEQLRALAARRWQLAREVILAQEDERYRVSRELHDEAGQALTALKVSLEMMLKDLTVPEPMAETMTESMSGTFSDTMTEPGVNHDHQFRKQLASAVEVCEATMAQIRILAHDLRPAALDDLGLNLTLEGYCRDFVDRTRLRIEYIGQELPALPGEAEICLYRFLQEALTNVAKHSRAQRVQVTLHCHDDTVSLAVEDNGRGFDRAVETKPHCQTKGIGLLGMQERLESLGGRLEIETAPGRGARLVATVPHAPR